MNPITYFLGLDAKGGLHANISLMLIRVSITLVTPYVIFDVWLGYHYVYFGYNLFFWIFIGAIVSIGLEAALEEEEKDEIDYSEYERDM